MTWAVTIAYGLLVMAGEAFHLLPGCGHHSVACGVATSNSQDASSRDESKTNETQCSHDHLHSRCNLGQHASKDSGSKAGTSSSKKLCVTITHQDHECQICKLMASLAAAVQPISSVPVQPESVVSDDSIASLLVVATVESSLFIRGPPRA